MTQAVRAAVWRSPRQLAVLSGIVLLAFIAAIPAQAAMDLLAPRRVIDPSVPLQLTLMITGEAQSRDYALPEVLQVALTPDVGAVVRVALQRQSPVPDTVNLRSGEFLRVVYSGVLPGNLRGRVRIDALGMDAPPMLVQLSSPRAAPQLAALPPAEDVMPAPPADGPPTVAIPVTALRVRSDDDPNWQPDGRLSFFEPMFFAVGDGSDANAQIQLSFKLRLYEPLDKTSRAFLHNLYFGYTQPAFWDLSSYSKPFIDTNYMPSFFYFVPNTDWRIDDNSVGIAAGIEHESNGKDGLESRSLDTLFARPYMSLGDARDFHWTFSPKLYAYIEKSENSDIPEYRGYGDFNVSYGKHDDWQAAWILRKGTGADKYSAELQATYPLNRWVPGLSGYLMLQAFNGYGEYLLDYNEHQNLSVRIGYAISR